MSSLKTLYGVSVQDAIDSGDIEKMRNIHTQALEHLANAKAVAALLPKLEAELARLGAGAPIKVLYGVAVQDAIARGDQAAMKALAAEAQGHLDTLNANITDPPIVVLYGVAVHDAIRGGDVAKMKQLADTARGLLAKIDAELKQ